MFIVDSRKDKEVPFSTLFQGNLFISNKGVFVKAFNVRWEVYGGVLIGLLDPDLESEREVGNFYEFSNTIMVEPIEAELEILK